jgi:hypothetical protein
MDPKIEFWNSLIRAVEAEPKQVSSIQGKSGLVHPVVALGVDDSRKRVVIISGESDPRVAAMAQTDIQSSMPSVKVVMARPAPINLGGIAKILTNVLGRTTFSLDLERNKWIEMGQEEMEAQLKKFFDIYGESIGQLAILPSQYALLNNVALWQEVIQQLSLIDVDTGRSISEKPPKKKKNTSPKKRRKKTTKTVKLPPNVGLSSLIALDPAELDRAYGVCSIPLYAFSQAEVDLFQSGKDIEYIQSILRKHDIFQYFFPPADQLALGIAEIRPATPSDIVGHLTKVPELGHPFGSLELVRSPVDLTEIIDALKDKGLMVEGEFGIELTKDGQAVRATVRYKPKEGLLQKISRVISMKLDLSLSDLFKP